MQPDKLKEMAELMSAELKKRGAGMSVYKKQVNRFHGLMNYTIRLQIH
jgi:hypothetical protein